MIAKNILSSLLKIVSSVSASAVAFIEAIALVVFNSLNTENPTRRQVNYVLFGLLWMSYVLVVPAEANPDLDKVVSGSVNIIESQNKLDVIQGTQKAIIDWRSFSIGVDEHTQFHHINSSAV